jgi:hypothetical protein
MFRKQVKGTIFVMTEPAKLVMQLSVVTMVFGNVSSVFRCVTCSGVMLRQSCLTFMLHTQACFPYYAGLSTMKQLSCCNTLQKVCQYYMYNKSYSTGNPKWYHIWDNRIVLTCTIVFATINTIKGNWQCIGTYVS